MLKKVKPLLLIKIKFLLNTFCKLAQINNSSHLQQKSDSLKRNQAKHLTDTPTTVIQSQSDHTIYAQIAAASGSSPIIVAGALKHTGVSKASNFPTPKNSPVIIAKKMLKVD